MNTTYVSLVIAIPIVLIGIALIIILSIFINRTNHLIETQQKELERKRHTHSTIEALENAQAHLIEMGIDNHLMEERILMVGEILALTRKSPTAYEYSELRKERTKS